MRRYNALGELMRENENDLRDVFVDSFFDNPILTGAVGVNLIAGGCISMGNACVMSVMLLVLLPIIGMIRAVEGERFSDTARPAIYTLISCVVVFLLSILINGMFTGSVERLGVFAPIIAFNALVLSRLSDDAPIVTVPEAAVCGAACACCFALLALPVAFIRELMNGELFASYLFDGLSGLQLSFAGFILCGLLLAVYRSIAEKGKQSVSARRAPTDTAFSGCYELKGGREQ